MVEQPAQQPIVIQMYTDCTIIDAKQNGAPGGSTPEPPGGSPCPDIVCVPASESETGTDCVYVQIGSQWSRFCGEPGSPPIIIRMYTDCTIIDAKQNGQNGDPTSAPTNGSPCPDIVCVSASESVDQAAATAGTDCVYVKIGGQWFVFC
jgi:hypothetical protein